MITKALSLRIAKVLPSIIHPSQMAYVEGRDINFNNRILSYSINNVNNESDVLVSFDAEKAFDSVSHEYLRNLLKRYNFPETFISFFNTIYKNNTAIVQVNGHLSEAFEVKRGVKQGDSLSCSLFILAMDPLIRNLEVNRNIEPLTINVNNKSIKVKVLAYADDIAVVTKNNESITETFKEYEKLFCSSGLRINADKTEILKLTNIVNNDNVITTEYLGNPLTIKPSDKVKICGNFLTTNPKERYALNVSQKIANLRSILLNWSKRNLSIYGKMLIIKCHALSQLTFVNQFQNITKSDIKMIESLCYKFLWNSGPDRVK